MFKRNLCSRRTLEAIMMAAVITTVNAGAPAMVLAEQNAGGEVEIITDVEEADNIDSDDGGFADGETILVIDENGNEVEMSMEEYDQLYGTDDTDITEPVLNLGGEDPDKETPEDLFGPRPEYDASRYVKLGDYANMTVTVFPKMEVTDEDLEYELSDRVLYSDQLERVEEGTVENGDQVSIDYTATVDGKEIEDLSDVDFQFPLGDGYFWDEFEEAILGANIGDTVSVVLPMDEDWYDEEVAGKDAAFSITLNAKYNIPEYSDDLAQKLSFGEAETWDAFREMVRKEMEDNYEEDFKYTVNEAIQEQLTEICEVNEYPEDVLAYDIERTKYNYEQYAQMFGMEMADFIEEYMGMEADEYEDSVRMEAMDNLEKEMIYECILKEENLEPDAEEMEAMIAEMAETYGFESADEFIETYTRVTIETAVRYEIVDAFLREKTTIIEDENLFDDEMFEDEEGVPIDLEDEEMLEDLEIEEDIVEENAEPVDHDA